MKNPKEKVLIMMTTTYIRTFGRLEIEVTNFPVSLDENFGETINLIDGVMIDLLTEEVQSVISEGKLSVDFMTVKQKYTGKDIVGLVENRINNG